MDPSMNQLIHIIVIVCVVLWLLSVLMGYSGDYLYPPPHHRY